jgi:hypothetical protein
MFKLNPKSTLVTLAFSVAALTGCSTSSSGSNDSKNTDDPDQVVKEFFSLAKYVTLTGQDYGLPIECADENPLKSSLVGDWVLTASTNDSVMEGFVILDSCLAADYNVGNETNINPYLPEGTSLPNGTFTYISGITSVVDTGTTLIFSDYNNQEMVINNVLDEVETSWNVQGPGGTYTYTQADNNSLILTDDDGSYLYNRK